MNEKKRKTRNEILSSQNPKSNNYICVNKNQIKLKPSKFTGADFSSYTFKVFVYCHLVYHSHYQSWIPSNGVFTLYFIIQYWEAIKMRILFTGEKLNRYVLCQFDIIRFKNKIFLTKEKRKRINLNGDK